MLIKNQLALSGGHAVGEAIRQINPDVMAVYPITPQTPIIEYFAKQVANGNAETEIIPVESEHSAMSACIGASAAGARTITASSSQGIMYMMETLPIASSMRLPIVMAVANRAISGPINIHADHSDAMAMRDFGWIQVFSENVQEAYDNMIIALKIAEMAMLPAAINLDGFYTSHSVENIEVLSDQSVNEFVGSYQPQKHLFDFDKPVTFGPLALQNSYFEFKKQIFDAMKKVPEFFAQVAEEFGEFSGRKYDPVESYRAKDAEKIFVAMGSASGTIKEAVDSLRQKGEKAGMVKVRLFRPFPYEALAKTLKNAKKIIVLDRNLAIGNGQVLASEVKSSTKVDVVSVVYGLGGRDLYQDQIRQLFFSNSGDDFVM